MTTNSHTIQESETATPAIAPTTPPVRRAELELARAVCCLFIIFIHVAPIHKDHPFGNFLFIIAKCCATQVFFLITGAFLSGRASFGKQLKRLGTKHVIPFLVTSLVIIQLWPAISRQIPLTEGFSRLNIDFRGFFAMWLAMDQNAYLNAFGYEHYDWVLGIFWFMFALYMCYLFFPLLKPLLADGTAAQSTKRYALGFGFVFTVLTPTVRILAPDSIAAGVPVLPESPFLYLWTMLVGNHLYAAMRKPSFTRSLCLLIRFLSPILFLVFVALIYHLEQGYDMDGETISCIYLERGFLLLFGANTAAFAFFCSLSITNPKYGDPIRWVADKVFYVYLVHMAVNQALIHWLFRYEDVHPVAPRILATLLVAALSFGLACGMRRVERRIRGLLSFR